MLDKCSKCNWIKFGEINRKALLLLIQTCLNIAVNFVMKESKTLNYPIIYPVVDKIVYQLGSCLSFFLFIFYTIRNKRKHFKNYRQLIKTNNKSEMNWTTKILWILLVTGFDFITDFIDSFIAIYNMNDNLNLFGFAFIFISAFSIWILNYKLYKHHYISMAIIIFLDALYNIVYGVSILEYRIGNKYSYLLLISLELFSSLELVLCKYLLYVKYIKIYEILFFEGLFLSALSIIKFIIMIKVDYVQFFWEYYENIDQKEIIILIILALMGFFISFLNLAIIDAFSPFHILLTELIPKNMFYIFYHEDAKELIINIIFTIIELFILFVFLEFIELNFLGLSKMTKRSIELRAKIESLEDDIDDINDINYEKKIVLDEYGLELEFKNEQAPDENNAKASDN